MKRHLIAIEWIGASLTQDGDTYTHEEALKEKLIHGFASGILVEEMDDRFIIARDWFDEHNTYRGVASYPKTGIIKVIKHGL